MENSDAIQDLDVLYTALEKDDAPIAVTKFLRIAEETRLEIRKLYSKLLDTPTSELPDYIRSSNVSGEGVFSLTSRQVDLNPNSSENIVCGYASLRTRLPYIVTVRKIMSRRGFVQGS